MEEYRDVEPVVAELAPSIADADVEYAPEVHQERTVVSSKDMQYGDVIKEIAQALHTQVYLEKSYIEPSDINVEGLFVDEYSDRSVYLLSENGTRRSACRYIEATKAEGVVSLPTARHFSLDPEVIKEVAGVSRLSDLKAHDVIEVSGLASIRLDAPDGRRDRGGELDATRLLYASILRHSLDAGHKLWLMNIEPAHLRALKILVGQDQVHTLGDAVEYMGPATVPVAINPHEVVRSAFADESSYGDMKRQYLLESLPGVSGRYLSDEVEQALTEHNVPYQEKGRLQRLMKHRRALAYTAIVGYSSARAVPVGAVEQFEGSVPLFLAIDVGTAFPYTWGLINAVSAKTTGRRIAGATVAGGSFIAPYAYFWAEGNDYPPYVNVVVGGMIGTVAALEARKVRKDRAIERALRAEHEE